VKDKSDPVSTLVRTSGRREILDPERKARMQEKVRRDWQAALERQRRKRRWIISAVAAAAAIVLLPVVWMSSRDPVTAGVVLRITGAPLLTREQDPTPRPLAMNLSIQERDEISTKDGARVLLDMTGNVMVRLDEQSAVQIVSSDAIRLVRGTLYIEAAEQRMTSKALTVITAFGIVGHVGTRFEARVTDDSLRIRVRDGTVSFKVSSGTQRLMKTGDELIARQGVVQVHRGPPAADSAWAWTQHIRPLFAIEGRTLDETLTWLAHEGGYQLVYASDAVRSRARESILHGTVDNMSAQEAFETVLAGSELRGSIEGDRALISAETPSSDAP
jgi:FecR protein